MTVNTMKVFYQRRRLRFEGIFFRMIANNKQLSVDEVRDAFRKACIEAEKEMFDGKKA